MLQALRRRVVFRATGGLPLQGHGRLPTSANRLPGAASPPPPMSSRRVMAPPPEMPSPTPAGLPPPSPSLMAPAVFDLNRPYDAVMRPSSFGAMGAPPSGGSWATRLANDGNRSGLAIPGVDPVFPPGFGPTPASVATDDDDKRIASPPGIGFLPPPPSSPKSTAQPPPSLRAKRWLLGGGLSPTPGTRRCRGPLDLRSTASDERRQRRPTTARASAVAHGVPVMRPPPPDRAAHRLEAGDERRAWR
ncbi:hypothetical protein ACP4OV_027225 [Aristida adscensionis]